MMRSLLFVAMVVMWSRYILAIQNIRVSNTFQNAAIVPDVIPVAPRDILEVYYSTSSVCLGSDIPYTHTALRPTIEYNARRGENYTLIMIDPDLPAAATPAFRSTLHGLVVNIPGENLLPRPGNTVTVPGEKIAGGREIAPYVPVIFYPGSGMRRYVFLLYIQTRTLDDTDRNLVQFGIDRIGFSITNFAMQYGLEELVAGNYFVSSLETSERYCKD